MVEFSLNGRAAIGIALALMAAAIGVGCALKQAKMPVVFTTKSGGNMGKPVAHFPSKQELQARIPIANAQTDNDNPISTLPVEKWELRTKTPPAGGSYGTESRWDKLLVQSVAGRDIAPSRALRCAAEESARFFVANAGYPDERLKEYLVARCGSPLVSTNYRTLHSLTTDTVPEERVQSELGASIQKLIDQGVASAPSEIALGFAQGSGRIAFVLFTGYKAASLNEMAPQIESNRVEISGTLSKDMAYTIGLITHGTYGFRRCEPDRNVQAPRFKMSCPVAEADGQARIEVAGHRADELLWDVALRLLVLRDPQGYLVYQRRQETANATAPHGDTGQALTLAINDTRRRAGRGDLQPVTEQTKVNHELTAYLHDAYWAHDRRHVEWAALGMLAGWEVPGVISDGGIYWFTQNDSTDAQAWVDKAIESPLGRWVLLDANKSRLAIGTHPHGKAGMLALVSTYALFESDDHRIDEDALFKEITALRRARGLADPIRIARSSSLTQALAKVACQSERIDDAAGKLLQEINTNARHMASIQVAESNSLFHFSAPEGLFKEALAVEVGVTHYKAPGGAWGQYALMFVIHNQRESKPQVAIALHADPE